MVDCLQPWLVDVLRRLYGLSDDEPITEAPYNPDKPDGQRLFYARDYNIGYCDRPCSGCHFGNPIRDQYMTDHMGYLRGKTQKPWLRTCFYQWLELPSDRDTIRHGDCTRINTEEMSELLDALAVLARYEEKCPECMIELGAIINKKDPFDIDRDFKEWIRKRAKRGVL